MRKPGDNKWDQTRFGIKEVGKLESALTCNSGEELEEGDIRIRTVSFILVLKNRTFRFQIYRKPNHNNDV